MTKLTIAYANTIDFYHPLKQRPQHLMEGLSRRGHQILWVNQTKNPDIFRTRISDNFTIYHDWEKFVNKFKGTIDILYTSWSHRWVDIEQLQPNICTIYDSLDKFSQNESQEEIMLQKANIVLTTTSKLLEERKIHNPNIYLCPNGCFTELGNKQYPIPSDLQNLPKPWILFSGALSDSTTEHGWCDLDLVKKISEKFTLIVVGQPWGISPKNNYKLKNIKFLGTKSYEELQKYYSNADVNILPFANNQVAQYSQPLKVIEALSHGKINVCTNIIEAKLLNQKNPNVVYISRNHDEFIQNIYKALKYKDSLDIQNQARELASEYDWEKQIDVFERAIGDFCKSKEFKL